MIYLKEHGDMSYEDLLEKAAAATISFNALSAKIKELESQMTANGELQKQIVNYAKTVSYTHLGGTVCRPVPLRKRNPARGCRHLSPLRRHCV